MRCATVLAPLGLVFAVGLVRSRSAPVVAPIAVQAPATPVPCDTWPGCARGLTSDHDSIYFLVRPDAQGRAVLQYPPTPPWVRLDQPIAAPRRMSLDPRNLPQLVGATIRMDATGALLDPPWGAGGDTLLASDDARSHGFSDLHAAPDRVCGETNVRP